MILIQNKALRMLRKEKPSKVGFYIKRNKAGWEDFYLINTLEACNF